MDETSEKSVGILQNRIVYLEDQKSRIIRGKNIGKVSKFSLYTKPIIVIFKSKLTEMIKKDVEGGRNQISTFSMLQKPVGPLEIVIRREELGSDAFETFDKSVKKFNMAKKKVVSALSLEEIEPLKICVNVKEDKEENSYKSWVNSNLHEDIHIKTNSLRKEQISEFILMKKPVVPVKIIEKSELIEK